MTPAPAATCEPADPTVAGWHWLEHSAGDPNKPYWWGSGHWWPGQTPVAMGFLPGEMAAMGYSYAAPCPTPAELAERDRLLRALAKVYVDLKSLIEESSGVAGLHLNGDLAHWHELVRGGRFEEWLLSYSAIDESDLGRAALELAKGPRG